MSSQKESKILVSGVKPTGKLHLGNYLGAIKQMVNLSTKGDGQEKYQSFIFIADLHALTTVQNAQDLSEYIFEAAVDHLALGIDPEKVTFFKQSDVPQVAELTWIFNCITSMPFLSRAHAYKDAQAKNREINVGTFDYPMLMASDILIHNPHLVPVGQDQKQHVEYARDTAEKFNRIFGETFRMPKAYILEEVETIPGTDGRKMSKSYKNTIDIFADDQEIKKSVMAIPTDSKGIDEPKDPEQDTIFSILKHFAEPEELREVEKRYLAGGIGYKEAKEILVKNLVEFVSPLREKREKLYQDRDYIKKVLKEGGLKAWEKAESKMKEVREKVGLTFHN